MSDDQRARFLTSLSAFGLVCCPPIAIITSIVVTMQASMNGSRQSRLTRAAVFLFVATVVFSLCALGLVVNAIMSNSISAGAKVWMFAACACGLLLLDIGHAYFVNVANCAITDGRVGEVEKRLRKLRGMNWAFNLSGSFFMPCLLWFGIPYVFKQLRPHVQDDTFGWRRTRQLLLLWSILECVCWLALIVLSVTRVDVTHPCVDALRGGVCPRSAIAITAYWYIVLILYLLRTISCLALIASVDGINTRLISSAQWHNEDAGPRVTMIPKSIAHCPRCNAACEFARAHSNVVCVRCHQCSNEFLP